MGLSASQARLLSLTARISDNELQSQQIANSKVRLADKTQEASKEYINALNTNKLMYTMYNSDGNSYQNQLTAGLMYEYGDMKNQYGISNAHGQLLVNGTDAKNFESSNSLTEFCEKYGIETVDNPNYITSLGEIYGTNYEALSENGIDELKQIQTSLQSGITAITNDLKTIPNLTNPNVSHNAQLSQNISNMENNVISSLGSTLGITKDDIINKTDKLDGLGAIGTYLSQIHYTPGDWPTLGVTKPTQPPEFTEVPPTEPKEVKEPTKPVEPTVQKPEFIPPDMADYSMISMSTLTGDLQCGAISQENYAEDYVRESGDGIFDVMDPDNNKNLDWYLEVLAHLLLPFDDYTEYVTGIFDINIVPDDYSKLLQTTTGDNVNLTPEYLNDSSINNRGKAWDTKYVIDAGVTYYQTVLYLFDQDGLRNDNILVSTDESDYVLLYYSDVRKDEEGNIIPLTEEEKLLNNYKIDEHGNITLKTWSEKATDLYYLALKVKEYENVAEQEALTEKINEGIKELFYEDAVYKPNASIISGVGLDRVAYNAAYEAALKEYEASSEYQTWDQAWSDYRREMADYEQDMIKYENYLINLAIYQNELATWESKRQENADLWTDYNNKLPAYETAEDKYLNEVNAWKADVQEWLNSLQSAYNSVSAMIDSMNKIIDLTVPDPENAKTEWYTNLWHRMNGASTTKSEEGKSGKYYKQLEDNLLTSPEWLQFALEHGVVTLEQVKYVEEGEDVTGLENTKWCSTSYSSCPDIVEVEDEVAIAKAEAEYTKKLNEIEAKDKKYDNDLKKLDTEHSALQTEYDSIKSVIEKNVERSFKAFS